MPLQEYTVGCVLPLGCNNKITNLVTPPYIGNTFSLRIGSRCEGGWCLTGERRRSVVASARSRQAVVSPNAT